MKSSLALYVHWPWCESKCPYCDFNSHASAPDGEAWLDAILAEMKTEAAGLGLAGRPLTSIFFGGGTPSLMSPLAAALIIEEASTLFSPTDDIEITLEANPSSTEIEKFRSLRAAGVNRVSIGVQSFDNDALAFLGRAHDGEAAERAITAASDIFPRFSFDLIYARPGQSEDTWRKELETALSFGPKHLSLYQLTIEPGTQFSKDRVMAAGEDDAVTLYQTTGAIMGAAGLRAYEVSNYAAAGEGARHNLHVWRGGDYLGIGPGAHGRIFVPGATGTVCFEPGHWEAARRIPDPARWIDAVTKTKTGMATREMIDAPARAEEIIMGALRLAEGLDVNVLKTQTSIKFEDRVSAGALRWLLEDGFLEKDDSHVRTTDKGRLMLNAVTAKLLA